MFYQILKKIQGKHSCESCLMYLLIGLNIWLCKHGIKIFLIKNTYLIKIFHLLFCLHQLLFPNLDLWICVYILLWNGDHSSCNQTAQCRPYNSHSSWPYPTLTIVRIRELTEPGKRMFRMKNLTNFLTLDGKSLIGILIKKVLVK